MIALVAGWGGDLSFSPAGDIAVAPVQTEVEQRIVRRLLTNAGDYIWHVNYGAGLGSYVGEVYSPRLMESSILNQMQLESLVATVPTPVIQTDQSLGSTPTTTSVTIQYHITGTSAGNFIIIGLGS
jgi:hypothetical protein